MKQGKKYTPYKKGYVNVTDGYTLYYELYGNPTGKPLVFLHGGPGSGFSDDSKRFFNPKVWNVLIFDQRGAGKSKPFASIENNTTQKIIEDIKYLMDMVGFKKAVIFGGSWGSTLALTYAISYPETVAAMILRGIWLGTNKENDYTFHEMKWLRPALWERFMSLVPEDQRSNLYQYYLDKMRAEDKKISDLYAYEWAFYESALLHLKTSLKDVEKDLKNEPYKALSILEAHYFINECFLPKNYILNNLHKIAHIPTSITHGEYDLVCPPLSAYEVHKRLKNSTLQWILAGHSSSDPEMDQMLIKETKRFEKLKY